MKLYQTLLALLLLSSVAFGGNNAFVGGGLAVSSVSASYATTIYAPVSVDFEMPLPWEMPLLADICGEPVAPEGFSWGFDQSCLDNFAHAGPGYQQALTNYETCLNAVDGLCDDEFLQDITDALKILIQAQADLRWVRALGNDDTAEVAAVAAAELVYNAAVEAHKNCVDNYKWACRMAFFQDHLCGCLVLVAN